jgi:hypothetical protein
MSDGVAGTFKITASWVATKTVETIPGTFSDTLQSAITYTGGVGDGQLDTHYIEKAKSLAGSGTDTYDLQAALTNVFGDAHTPILMKALILINNSGNGAVLTLGGAANQVPFMSDPASDKIIIPDGGFFAWAVSLNASAIAVTAGTGDIITITETAAQAATYDLLVAGVLS